MLHHLRDGFFAPRAGLVSALADRFTAWLDGNPAEDSATVRLPLFWVGGRSGCGKSVMLLQLLARLHAEGMGPILWLGNRRQQMPDAARWTRSPRHAFDQVLIGVDDPYEPAGQEGANIVWRDLLAEVEAFRQLGDAARMPIVVACGPTDQALRLRRDFPDEIALELAELPTESADDYRELRDWYQERTGVAPPEVGDDNLLLVQLFFEWRTGLPLRAFAKRFRDRLRAADRPGEGVSLDLFVARLLALNRLYVGLPGPAAREQLTPRQRDAFTQLEAEMHITAGGQIGREGMWLAHPHLSNAIYDAWFPPREDDEQRLDHLRTAIELCEEYGATPSERTAPLWALAHQTSSGPSGEQSRVDPRAGELLAEVYQRRTAADAVPATQLPIWIEVGAVVPSVTLDPSPVALALEGLEAEEPAETGYGQTCHKMLQHFARMTDADRLRVRECLRIVVTRYQGWRLWPSIVARAIEVTGDEQLIPPVLEWCRGQLVSAASCRLLTAAMRTFEDREEITALARAALPAAPCQREWAELATLLLARDRAAREVVRGWVEEHRREPNVAHILGTMLEHDGTPARGWAMEWAATWHGLPQANRVLEPLIGVFGMTDELRHWSLRWIELEVGDTGLIARHLVDGGADRAWTVRWLRGVGAQSVFWGDVWRRLWTNAHGDGELEGLALEWLERTGIDNPGWSYVWHDLRAHRSASGHLDDMALARLTDTVARDIVWWGQVWRRVWEFNRGRGELVRVALDHLRRADRERFGWVLVAGDLLAGSPDRVTFADIQPLLPAPTTWARAWDQAWNRQLGDPGLVALALHWLEIVPAEHPRWGYVWRDLWFFGQCRSRLATLALAWLEAAPPDHRSWGYVWQDVWAHRGQPAELEAIGMRWLERTGGDHAAWPRVWSDLWRVVRCREELLDLALRVFADPAVRRRHWRQVLLTAWQADGAEADSYLRPLELLTVVTAEDDTLLGGWGVLDERRLTDELVHRWLLQSLEGARGWAAVWRRAWRQEPGSAALTSLAVRWLTRDGNGADDWPNVWLALWEHAPGAHLESLAIERLVSASDGGPARRRVWRRVWSLVLDRRRRTGTTAELISAVLARMPPSHPEWGTVFLDLRRTDGEALGELGRRWLIVAPPGHPAWVYVWGQVSRLGAEAELTRPVAFRLLAGDSTPPEVWSMVWCWLWEVDAARQPLFETALAWLQRTPADEPRWVVVWERLWDHLARAGALTADHELVELTRDWLVRAAPQHPGWPSIWAALKHQDLMDGLSLAGVNWLIDVRTSTHRDWRTVWRSLLEDYPSDVDRGGFVVAALDAMVARDPRWVAIWQEGWRLHPGDPGLRDRAIAWLGDARKHAGWGAVWRDLVEWGGLDEQLTEIGLAWIGQVTLKHSAWSDVWCDLWHVRGEDPLLIEAGRAWLGSALRSHPVIEEAVVRHSADGTAPASTSG